MEKNITIKLTNAAGVDAIAQVPFDLDSERFKGMPEKLIARDLVDAINRDPALNGKLKASLYKPELKIKFNVGTNSDTRITGEQENNS